MSTAMKSQNVVAIRDIQAGREYFSFFVKFKDAHKFFDLQRDLPLELRSQRPITKRRITQIKDYLFNNMDTFVLPSVTACTSIIPVFLPNETLGGVAGTLTVKEKLQLHDGQHRIGGILEFMSVLNFLMSKPRKNKVLLDSLGIIREYNSIPVTLFYDAGLKRSRQIFSDINRYCVKPNISLIREFDTRGT